MSVIDKNLTLTPARKLAQSRNGRLKRRVIIIISLLFLAYIAFFFVSNGYTSGVKLERGEAAERQVNKDLNAKRQSLHREIQKYESLGGQEDVMRRAGKFKENEVPIVIIDSKTGTTTQGRKKPAGEKSPEEKTAPLKNADE